LSADAIREKWSNNIDLLRLCAAIMVIFSHSFALSSGNNDSDPLSLLTGGIITMGGLGVVIFFIISGYLITKSWVNRPKISTFLQNRILRIVPGLIALSFFTVLIVGPLSYNGSLIKYLLNFEVWKYIAMPLTLGTYGMILPGTFVNNPYPGVINASLWTLLPEFKLYLIVLILGVTGLLAKKKLMILAVIVLSLLYFIGDSFNPAIQETAYVFTNMSGLSHPIFPLLPVFFLCGSLYYSYNKKNSYNLFVSLLLLLVWILSLKTGFFYLASIICLPYLVLFLSFAKIPCASKAGKYGDFSYGLYIYAFPVQQLIALYFTGITAYPMFVLSMLSIFPLAVLSWKLVESRSLRLKNVNFYEKIFAPGIRHFTQPKL
jgi:peptidoglycan/LPS O-acetylase OafA/YrhL